MIKTSRSAWRKRPKSTPTRIGFRSTRSPLRLRSRVPFRQWIDGSLVLALGISLLFPGIRLAVLGGTDYYWIAGCVLVLSGVLLLRDRNSGLSAYGVFLLGTLLWAFYEVGLDGLKLIPRVALPAALGIWLAAPWLIREFLPYLLSSHRIAFARRLRTVACIMAVTVGLGAFTVLGIFNAQANIGPPKQAVVDGDWRHYGRSLGAERFSPLTQITPENVSELEPAWIFRTGDLPSTSEKRSGRQFDFDNTPIKVGNTLYLCTPHRRVIALDAASGRVRWRFDPASDLRGNARLSCRGVSFFSADTTAACPRRIISTTGDGHLVALDADTGEPCRQFGRHGFVSLTQGMGRVGAGEYVIDSPPLVVSDRIIVGGRSARGTSELAPSGVVRAYDAQDGGLLWSWDIGRRNPNAPLAPGQSFTRGTPDAWGAFTADPALGLVFVPLGNTAPMGANGERRPFDEKYSSALVALEIATGKERWRFKTVEHDLWDLELASGPSLVDFPTSRGTVRALVQSTRTGELFMLNRRTGKPFTEVRRVETPGEVPQLRSVGLPALTPERLDVMDTWGVTPLDHLWCRIQYRQHRYEGPFTPPSYKGSIAYPASDGVMDSFGMTIDPGHRIVIASSSYMPYTVRLTPEGTTLTPWLNPLGVPCNAPPWGKLTAINLSTRSIVWQRPLGTTRDSGPLGLRENLALETGIFNKGGSIITRSGIIFIAATADQFLRAFDRLTGRELWKARLPAGGQATPMTFMEDGRQYVVIAAGGNSRLRTKHGDYVIAFALPAGD